MPELRVSLLALVAASATFSAPAGAAGYYVGDIGARGMARGGAFIAAPDSILAIHYNPAGLAQLRGLHVEASLTLLDGALSLTRTCPCLVPDRLGGLDDAAALDAKLSTSFAARPVENGFGFRPIPFIGVAYGVESMNLTVALAAYGPHGTALDYGPSEYALAVNQPQRYSVLSSESVEANYQLGLAFEPLEGLRIGAALTIYGTRATQRLHIYANTVLTPFAENVSTQPRLADREVAFDIPVEIRFARGVAFDGSLGVSYEIGSGWVAGASFRGKRSVRAEGTLAASVPELLTASGIAVVGGGGPVEVELDLPAIARLAIAYRAPERFGVELAAVYEGWSVHDRVKIRAGDVKLDVNGVTSSLGTLALERQWRDTFSARVAGDLAYFDPWFGATFGAYFEPSAVPRERLSASTFDLDKVGLAFGIRTELRGVRLDLVAQHVLLIDASVRDSKVEMPAVLDPRGPENPDGVGADNFLTVIGNGDYSGSFTMLTAGVSVELDGMFDE